ncbi:MAG TPA: TetR family transcriptional regulator [Pseudonocardia sp.]|jgi:AcrR family transcriptional regulator
MAERLPGRRSPTGPERKRDAARTREVILDAALAEFGEHGYTGARTSGIAERAGVNQQLISYYFGGKAGLYRAVQQRWSAVAAPLRRSEVPLAEVVTNFVRLNAEHRTWARMLLWGELTGEVGGSEPDARDYFAAMVDDLRARQGRGELAADLDPAFVLLVLFAAGLAPQTLPRIAREMTGLAPGSPDFVERYCAELVRVVERLATG